MTPFEFVRALTEIKGRAHAAYHAAEEDSGMEMLLDRLHDDLGDIIEIYVRSSCCSPHFIRGGQCRPKDPTSCCEHE